MNQHIILFRKSGIIFLSMLALISCKSDKNPNIPDNAVDPATVQNPVSAYGKKAMELAPVITLETDKHDFGTITQGEKVSFAFSFVNTGKSDLVIRHAQGSCGCTVPDYPKTPVKPGEKGIINVTFNSEGKEGKQAKTVDIISNTIPNVVKLYIYADIVKENKP